MFRASQVADPSRLPLKSRDKNPIVDLVNGGVLNWSNASDQATEWEEAMKTRQMPCEPLPASVLFVPFCFVHFIWVAVGWQDSASFATPAS